MVLLNDDDYLIYKHNHDTSYMRCMVYNSLFLIFRKTTRGKEDDDGCRDVLYVQNVINMKLLYVIDDQSQQTFIN